MATRWRLLAKTTAAFDFSCLVGARATSTQGGFLTTRGRNKIKKSNHEKACTVSNDKAATASLPFAVTSRASCTIALGPRRRPSTGGDIGPILGPDPVSSLAGSTDLQIYGLVSSWAGATDLQIYGLVSSSCTARPQRWIFFLNRITRHCYKLL